MVFNKVGKVAEKTRKEKWKNSKSKRDEMYYRHFSRLKIVKRGATKRVGRNRKSKLLSILFSFLGSEPPIKSIQDVSRDIGDISTGEISRNKLIERFISRNLFLSLSLSLYYLSLSNLQKWEKKVLNLETVYPSIRAIKYTWHVIWRK